jgi:hypothetical protein
MQIAILALSAIGAATGVASLVIMAKTRKNLIEFGADLRADIENTKTNTNSVVRGLRSALDGIEL